MPGDLSALPSLSRRLNRLVVAAVGLALLLGGALGIWQELARYAEAKRGTLFATAQVFSAASSRAVAARDEAGIMQALRAVARVPGLLYAEVKDVRGENIAEIGNAERLTRDPNADAPREIDLSALLRSRTVGIAVPVLEAGRIVGSLELVSDTADLPRQLLADLGVTAGVSLLTLAVGLLLAARLRRRITQPLETLSNAMAAADPTRDTEPVPETGDRETALLARSFNQMTGAIRIATDEILAREDEIIRRLARAAEQRDDQTGQHVHRVAALSRIIASEMGLDAATVDAIHRASPMHDVGKISIPDHILHKPGRLDPEERRIMETHASAGHLILAGSKSALVQLAAQIALTHHERWDGQGYPNRLAGEAIPLPGRITAVADVCDALLSPRPYKAPWTFAAVKAHLIENAGTHFDATCVDALVRRWADLRIVYAQMAAVPIEDGDEEERKVA